MEKIQSQSSEMDTSINQFLEEKGLPSLSLRRSMCNRHGVYMQVEAIIPKCQQVAATCAQLHATRCKSLYLSSSCMGVSLRCPVPNAYCSSDNVGESIRPIGKHKYATLHLSKLRFIEDKDKSFIRIVPIRRPTGRQGLQASAAGPVIRQRPVEFLCHFLYRQAEKWPTRRGQAGKP